MGKEKRSCRSCCAPAHPKMPKKRGRSANWPAVATLPADWIFRARIISLSWQGLRTAKIAEELGCHPKTVRKRLHRFNAEGIDGLGDRPGAGRKPRLTEYERSRIIALAQMSRRAVWYAAVVESSKPSMRRGQAHWTLDALAAAAQQRGIEVSRTRSGASCCEKGSVGAILVRGPRARTPSLSQKSQDRRALHRPARGSTVICLDELGPVSPRAFPPAPGWSLDGHRIKAPLEYSRGPEKVWVFGALRVEDGQSLTLTARSRNTKGYLRLLQEIEQANPTERSTASPTTSPPTRALRSGSGWRAIRG